MKQEKTRWVLLVGVLALALLVPMALAPLGATGVSPQPTDISIAYPLTSSPVTTTVDATAAPDAVFASPMLGIGDQMTASLTATPGTDLDLRIYSTWASSVSDTFWVVASSATSSYPEAAHYKIEPGGDNGVYYIDVHAGAGAGIATLAWSVKRATSASLTTNHNTVAYNGSATLSASLKDSLSNPVRYKYLRIYRSYNNSSWTYWKSVKTAWSGGVAVSVAPTRRTYYRVRFEGTSDFFPSAYSASVWVAPKVGLGQPVAPSSMTCNKTYTIYGNLHPHQSVGSHLVSLRAYRYEGGTWVLKKTVSTNAYDYSSYSRYKARIALGTPGKWQLRAYVPAGSMYASTLSAPEAVTVPTQKAAKVSAWVSDSTPDKYTYVTAYGKVKDAYGKVIPNAKVTFTWHYKTVTHSETWKTNSSGVAECTRYIASASSGYRVRIDVVASSGGGTAKTSTGFTPN